MGLKEYLCLEVSRASSASSVRSEDIRIVKVVS
jgi:hypothetical protein